MTALVIVLLVLALLFAIRIEIHIDNTYWKEKSTDRPIIVLHYDEETGVKYQYAGDPFERHMDIWTLITKFTYVGDK